MSRIRLTLTALALVALLSLAAGAAMAQGAQHARATLHDAAGNVVGFATFVEDAAGRVHVNVHATSLSEGLHGLHLHAVGSCLAPAFTSAGGHINPDGRQHGLDHPAGPHAGDLPNLTVNPAGLGRLNAMTEGVTLSAGAASLLDLDGSALVVHAFADDQVTQPIGGSGPRVACGVIEGD